MTISLSDLNAGFYAGDKGNVGGTGAKGDKGDIGEKGELGQKGITGDKGDQGEVGVKGDKGTTGDTGQKGDTGSKGNTGDVEAQGNKGDKGVKGETGQFGGASFDFNYTDLTANAEPGDGYLRFNNTTLASASILFIDQQDSSGANTYGYLQTIDDSTSSIKGTFTITEVANNDNFAYFNITGTHGHYSHYFEIPITFLTGPASFSNNSPVIITFARTGDAGDKGDKGDQGATGSKGDTGTTGTTGDTGVKGDKGDVGEKGQKGEEATLPQALGTSANVQFGSLGVGTAASGTTGEIRATQNITAYYSSDQKFKENIHQIENALEKVIAIGGKTFEWTEEYISQHGGEDGYFIRKKDFGVIAQDVEKVFPIAIRLRDDNSLAVDYDKLVALAFAAIVELKYEIDKNRK